ncbi:MAG: C1 family peptidase [Candidatus Sericytochromatia bacterium]|nr:C1 family peptidase [Candidatus Sericytochromatia bacterium]
MKSPARFMLPGLLALSALAGCGAPAMTGAPALGQPASAAMLARAAETDESLLLDARRRSGFRFGLGADLKGAKGVTVDGEDGGALIGFETMASRPVSIDLRRQCSPVANQGQFGSCTSFATVKGLQEFLLRKRGNDEPQSPAYIWYQTRAAMGMRNEDSGAPMELATKMLDNLGTVDEAAFPYLDAKGQEDAKLRQEFLSRKPGSDLVAAAKKKRIVSGFSVATKLSAVRTSLEKGMPVLLGMMVFQSIGKTGKDGLMPIPTDNDKFMGGHAVLAVGYDDKKQVLIIRNSWGSDWAAGGYFLMPYSYVKMGGLRVAVVPKT